MLNINIGGTKHWNKISPKTQKCWKILDVKGDPDFLYDLNSSKYFPLKAKVVDNYYTSHTLEHICPQILPFVLNEVYRTLKVGGKIRVVVPDVQLAIQKYVNNDKIWMARNYRLNKIERIPYPKTLLGHLMSLFYSIPKGKERSGHNVVFDWRTLHYYFKQVGFGIIVKSKYQRGSGVFKGLDLLMHRDKSLYLEAVK